MLFQSGLCLWLNLNKTTRPSMLVDNNNLYIIACYFSNRLKKKKKKKKEKETVPASYWREKEEHRSHSEHSNWDAYVTLAQGTHLPFNIETEPLNHVGIDRALRPLFILLQSLWSGLRSSCRPDARARGSNGRLRRGWERADRRTGEERERPRGEGERDIYIANVSSA